MKSSCEALPTGVEMETERKMQRFVATPEDRNVVFETRNGGKGGVGEEDLGEDQAKRCTCAVFLDQGVAD